MKVLVVGAGMYVTGRHGTGAGTILASLAQASREQPIEEVLVVARNPENAAHVADAVRRIDDLLGTRLAVRYQPLGEGRSLSDQLRLDDFGCAIVSVPDHAHFDVAADLLERGLATLVVKPLVPTTLEAQKLIAIQQRSRAYGAVEFHKRWDEGNLLAKRYIAEGRLGPLVYGVVEYSQRISIPTVVFRGWTERTNIFQYLGCHYVDLFYFLTGLRPVAAMAVGTRGALWRRGIRTFDTVHAHVLWNAEGQGAHTFTTQLVISWIDPTTTSALSDQRIKIIGEKGRIELDQKDRGIELVTEDSGIQHPNPYFAEYLPDDAGGRAFQGYGYKSIACFLRDVADLRRGSTTLEALEALRPTLKHSLVSTAIVEAVNDSLEQDFSWRRIQCSV
jgi:predicted dehydrogenase